MNRNQLRLLRLENKISSNVTVIDETCDTELSAAEIAELGKRPGTIIRLIDDPTPIHRHATHWPY